MLKEERAIVTEYEGTTRDTIEEFLEIDGIPIRIIDTAGIRNAKDEVEKIGIKKSKEVAETADLIIAIFDITKKLDEEDKKILDIIGNKKSIIVLNKIDLVDKVNIPEEILKYENIIEMSALNKQGIEEMYNKIAEIFKFNDIEEDNKSVKKTYDELFSDREGDYK